MNLKKPKFWDYKKPNIYAFLLFPLTILTSLSNFFNLKKNKIKFKIKTICIGNIYIGGTGKTSLSIKLNKILKERNIKTCFIKKQYIDQVDEQKILKKNGELFISKKRIDAIKQAENANYEVAIIDDGLQETKINYDIRIVCFNTINWIGNGMILPSGPLRENINNLKKYEHIFLNGNSEELESHKKFLTNINPNVNIHIGVYEITNVKEFNLNDKFLIFSGIGNHKTFVEMIKKYGFEVLKDIEFPDHYNYTDVDLNKIVDEAKKLNCKIITTEKDYFRLEDKNLIEIKFIKSELKLINEENLLKFII
tara:strand:+ start:943 stop:1869 length:927 start_codon:yes stop_codon:yes gene_type:complete